MAGKQIVIGPASAILAVGNGFTVTVTEDVVLFEHASVTVTVYVVVTVGLTVICAVAAYEPAGVDAHAYENGAPPVAPPFSVTEVPAQTGVDGVAVALAPTGVRLPLQVMKQRNSLSPHLLR